jgi:hypothetical protein
MYFYCVLLYVYVSIICLCIYFMFMYLLYVYVDVFYVFILCLCIYCRFMYLHRASWHSSVTLTEVSHAFLSCKANARVQPTKMGHGPHSSKIFVLLYVLFVLCCSVYCCV